jgi:hypothetical protein
MVLEALSASRCVRVHLCFTCVEIVEVQLGALFCTQSSMLLLYSSGTKAWAHTKA